MAGGTPAFPALRVLGARASRRQRREQARPKKKPTPLRTQGVRAHRWVHGVQANKWCQVHFRQVRALPKLELSEEQIVELVRQLSPDAKRRVMQLLGSVPDHSAEPEASVGEFAQLPCFGMWADHEALQDSDAWVRKERERWHRRASRRD